MKYLIALALTSVTFFAQAQDACGSAGEQSFRNIIDRYSRFTDSQTQNVVRESGKTPLARNVQDMIGRGGGVSGAIAGVAGELENSKRQMRTAAEGFCAGSAACSGGPSNLGWPEKLPNTFTDSAGMQRVFAMTSLMHDLNSLTLAALRQCPGR